MQMMCKTYMDLSEHFLFSLINNYSHVPPSTIFVKLMSFTDELLLCSLSLFLYHVSVIGKLSVDVL